MSPVRFPNVAAFQWTPKQLPNLITWLDADDESTLTLSGSNVTDWNDKSGSGNHVTQTTAARRPAQVTNYQNGRDIIDFMWTSAGATNRKWLARQGTYTNITGSALSVFVACQVKSDWDPVARLISFAASSTGDDYNANSRIAAIHRAIGTPSPDQVQSFYNNAGTNAANVTVGNWHVLGMIVSGTSHTMRVNGTSTTTTLGSTPAFNINTMMISNNPGTFTTLQHSWNGPVGELVVCNTNLGTSDRDKIEGYLAWRWGFASSLAAGHAYKNFPPSG